MGQFLDTEYREFEGSVGGTFARIVPATLLNWDDSGELMDIHEIGFDDIPELEDLNWARLQTDQLPFCPVTIDLNTVIHQIISLYKPRAEEKQIVLTVEGAKVQQVSADLEMLKTVLRNLVSNAIKFTPTGGKVSITLSKSHEKVCVEILDTGPGIPEDQINTLFEIKAVEKGRGNEVDSGSGFGLILCHEMIQRHEETLELETEEGQGTLFRFHVPLAEGNLE